MNPLKISIAIFSLVIVTSSCEKDLIEEFSGERNDQQIRFSQSGGGNDDEEPIIQGMVLLPSEAPAFGATVSLFRDGELFPMDTILSDENGIFQFQPDSGLFFLKVDLSGYSQVITESFEVIGLVQVNVTLE